MTLTRVSLTSSLSRPLSPCLSTESQEALKSPFWCSLHIQEVLAEFEGDASGVQMWCTWSLNERLSRLLTAPLFRKSKGKQLLTRSQPIWGTLWAYLPQKGFSKHTLAEAIHRGKQFSNVVNYSITKKFSRAWPPFLGCWAKKTNMFWSWHLK